VQKICAEDIIHTPPQPARALTKIIKLKIEVVNWSWEQIDKNGHQINGGTRGGEQGPRPPPKISEIF